MFQANTKWDKIDRMSTAIPRTHARETRSTIALFSVDASVMSAVRKSEQVMTVYTNPSSDAE